MQTSNVCNRPHRHTRRTQLMAPLRRQCCCWQFLVQSGHVRQATAARHPDVCAQPTTANTWQKSAAQQAPVASTTPAHLPGMYPLLVLPPQASTTAHTARCAAQWPPQWGWRAASTSPAGAGRSAQPICATSAHLHSHTVTHGADAGTQSRWKPRAVVLLVPTVVELIRPQRSAVKACHHSCPARWRKAKPAAFGPMKLHKVKFRPTRNPACMHLRRI
jgi:hypothetical protein